MARSRLEQEKGTNLAEPHRKPGRPFKHTRLAQETDPSAFVDPAVYERTPLRLAQGLPPAIPFRSFKTALSALKGQGELPARLDQSTWSSKLYNANVRETVAAFRFLGLIDANSAPTSDFVALVAAFAEASWPGALRCVLERSYDQVLACSVTTLAKGGLLQTFRTIYPIPASSTRKCCSFFMHAAHEAALKTNALQLVSANSSVRDKQTGLPHRSTEARLDPSERIVRDLLSRLPDYDASWSDEVKRLWFGAYHDLVQRVELRNPQS